jgi:N-acetylglucosaminyl-diphospho-decaprenol L-rhamnosyltransferase
VSSLDVVVVASRADLRACVEPLASVGDVRVIVVDDARDPGVLEAVGDLNVTTISLRADHGFAHACNVGWQLGDSAYVLFLAPQARVDLGALERLLGLVRDDPAAGLAAPWIVGAAASASIDGPCALLPRRELQALGGVPEGFSLHAGDAARGRHARGVLAAAGGGSA